MPIVRTYSCPECFHFMRVTLTVDQVDDPPPECPACATRPSMSQEFSAPAIVGKNHVRARDVALAIAEQDYGLADISERVCSYGEKPAVRYKDTSPTGGNAPSASWSMARENLEAAVAIGRQTRLKHGSSLDIIKEMPDLIEISKKRSARIW